MLFRDIKPGCILYAFDRANVEFKELKVVNVVPPHYDPNFPGATISDMVVDITVEGEPKPYSFKERSENASIGNLVISASIEGALSEVEVLKIQSEQALSQHEKLESDIEKCKKILTDRSPKYKKEQETEQRFSTIESSIGEMKELMQKQQEMMASFFNRFDKK